MAFLQQLPSYTRISYTRLTHRLECTGLLFIVSLFTSSSVNNGPTAELYVCVLCVVISLIVNAELTLCAAPGIM